MCASVEDPRETAGLCVCARVRADVWALLLTQAAFPFLKVNNLGPAAGPAAPLFQHLMPAPSSKQLSSTTRTSTERAQATLKNGPRRFKRGLIYMLFKIYNPAGLIDRLTGCYALSLHSVFLNRKNQTLTLALENSCWTICSCSATVLAALLRFLEQSVSQHENSWI